MKSIIFFGNCHLGFSKNVFARVAGITERYELFWSNHVNEPLLAKLPTCSIFIEQPGYSKDADTVRERLSAGCRIIRFPFHYLRSLWPLCAHDPRNLPSEYLPEGPYPESLGDRLVIRLLEERHDPATLFERYINTDLRELVDLERFHEINMHRMRASESACDVKVVPFIEANLTRLRLFIAMVHPGNALCREYCRQLFPLIDDSLPEADIRHAIDSIGDIIGIGAYHAPLHPQVIEFFKLTWAENLHYKYFDEGNFDHETFLRRYIAFTHAPEYAEGVSLTKRGQLSAAEAAFRTAIGRVPAAPQFHIQLGDALERQGRAQEAADCFARATDLAPVNAEAWFRLGSSFLKLRRPQDAEAAFQTAIGLRPETADFHAGLADALADQQHHDHAEASRRAALAMRQAAWPEPLLEQAGSIHGRYWMPATGSGY